jgi:phage replication O-like protein O
MATPQIEDGHSVIANELLDAIIKTHFSPIEQAIFWTVVRKTYGWHKKTDRISYTQFEESTGKDRWHIAPALQGLIKRNIIIRQGGVTIWNTASKKIMSYGNHYRNQ